MTSTDDTLADRGCCVARRQLDSKSVLSIYGAWKPPNDEIARQKYHASHLQHETFDPQTAKVTDFKEFGSGHLLYFYWLRYMAVLFAVLAVVPGLPMLVMNLGGRFLATGSMDMEATTIGNFGLPSTNADISSLPISLPSTNNGADAEIALVAYMQSQSDQPAVIMTGLHFNKLNSVVAATVLDLMGILVFFFACVLLLIKTRQMSDKVDEQVTTLPEYSVEVQGLPPDTTPEELKTYFEQWGEVAQVECARRCNTLMALVKDRRKVLDELDTAVAVLQRSAALVPQVDESLELDVLDAQYDLALLTEAIKSSQRAQGGGDVVRGYVTYNDDVGRDAALAAQPQGWFKRWQQPLDQRFRHLHRLVVTIAPQATDIYFENLEFTRWYRFAARSATWFLKFLLVFAGFTLVSLAPSIKRNVNGDAGPSSDVCDASCTWKNALGQLYLNDTLRDTYKQCHDTGTYANKVSCQGATICYECFCRAALGASMYQEASYCSAYSSVLLQAAGAQALTVATIVVVNFIVKLLIKAFTEAEKHRTRTREGLSMLTALFLTQFVNAAFSIIIANMYMPSVQGALPGVWRKVLFGGIYSDTSPNWYREVGKALLVSQLIGIPVRAASIGIDVLWWKWKRSRTSTALTQSQLENAYQGHEFQLAQRYGELLAVVFVCLLFSGAMPLMYWLLALSFVIHYHLERYELLKVCRWPVSYSSHLAKKVAHILPWAALGHLLAAVWMVSIVGCPRSALFGTSWAYSVMDSLCYSLRRLWSNTTQLTPPVMASRLTNQAVGHLLWGFVILSLGMLVAYSMPLWHSAYLRAVERVKAAQTRARQEQEEAEAKLRKAQEEEDNMEYDEDGNPIKTQAPISAMLAMAEPPKEKKGHSVPEFALAVRSKLLVGPQTYELRTNPNYAHAFERLDDVALDKSVMARVEERERNRKQLPSLRAELRRKRRQAARDALLANGSQLDTQGRRAGGQFFERLRTQQNADAPAAPSSSGTFRSNQVHPWNEGYPGTADTQQPWNGSDTADGMSDQLFKHTGGGSGMQVTRDPALLLEDMPTYASQYTAAASTVRVHEQQGAARAERSTLY